MAAREGLLIRDFQPYAETWWREYACATLQRLLFYGVHSWYERWAAWAGFTSFTIRPNTDDRNSNYVMMSDGAKALIAFDGTRGFNQWFWNIQGATVRTDANTQQRFHSYFLWRVEQIWQDVWDWINSQPHAPQVMFCGHSLGGAMAHIFARRLWNVFPQQSGGLLTFAQPRTVGGMYSTPERVPYLRITWKYDPVPNLPPVFLMSTRPRPLPLLQLVPEAFHHTKETGILLGNGLFSHGDNHFEGSAHLLPYRLLRREEDPRVTLMDVHNVERYCAELLHVARISRPRPDMYALDLINDEIDDVQAGTRQVRVNARATNAIVRFLPPPPEMSPQTNPFIGSNVSFPGPGVWPTIPPEDAGRRVEQRVVAHKLFFFGGRDTVAKQFQGHDRAMLKTLVKLVGNIKARDLRVGNPKPTRMLSNRILMYPPGGSPVFSTILSQVGEQAVALLALNK